MTDQATRVVPAGWYDDPASPTRVRWWNGIAWTEHVAEKPSPEQQAAARAEAERRAAEEARAAAEAATAARIAEARRLEVEFGIGTSETPVVGGIDSGAGAWSPAGAGHDGSATGAAGQDGAALHGDGYGSGYGAQYGGAQYGGGQYGSGGELRRDRTHRSAAPAAGTATGSAWLIALSPLLALTLAAAAGYVYLFFLPSPLVFAAVGIVYLLTLLWALADARALRARGYEPASGLLALLGALVYLIARRVRVPGTGPLLTFLLLAIGAIGLPAAAYAAGAATPIVTAVQVQDELNRELVGTGAASSVSCPLFRDSMEPGSIYTCDAVLPGGEQRLVWVSIDGADGDFSYAFAVR